MDATAEADPMPSSPLGQSAEVPNDTNSVWHATGVHTLPLTGAEIDEYISWCQAGEESFEQLASLNSKKYSRQIAKNFSPQEKDDFLDTYRKARRAYVVYRDVGLAIRREQVKLADLSSENEAVSGSKRGYKSTTFDVTIDFDRGKVMIKPQDSPKPSSEPDEEPSEEPSKEPSEELSEAADTESPLSTRTGRWFLKTTRFGRSRSKSGVPDERRPSTVSIAESSQGEDDGPSGHGKRSWFSRGPKTIPTTPSRSPVTSSGFLSPDVARPGSPGRLFSEYFQLNRSEASSRRPSILSNAPSSPGGGAGAGSTAAS